MISTKGRRFRLFFLRLGQQGEFAASCLGQGNYGRGSLLRLVGGSLLRLGQGNYGRQGEQDSQIPHQTVPGPGTVWWGIWFWERRVPLVGLREELVPRATPSS